ncbi:MAG TPA: GNAT family N-acetyltransferase [Candidatus Limnocylindrales bacterium]|jgi:GNAT superfamily N-acetyltransferase
MKQATALDLKIRPFEGLDDVPAFARILNNELKADGVPNFETEGDIRAWMSHPTDTFRPDRDVNLAFVDGAPVAYSEREWVDTNDGVYREYRINGAVLPEWRRKGIGTALLEYNVERARELAATQQTERQRVLGSWSNDRQAGRIALLQKQGFEPVRWFFEMTRDLSDPIPEVELPEGLEIRPVTDDNIFQVWHADVEAFKDHWGGFDDSDERLKSWMESPTFDPTLWVIAWDGDEVAAGNVNSISHEENAAIGVQRGWLNSVFTRRPWRKRGLANALIARSLQLIKDRGMDYGVLGVDAENPTGALGLYERNGFKVLERSTAWRKPL